MNIYNKFQFWCDKKNYPHFSIREEEDGLSNWITPSNGTSLSPTKTVWSLTKGEEDDLVDEVESMFPSALASVRWKGLMEVLLTW